MCTSTSFPLRGCVQHAVLLIFCALFALASRAQTDIENVMRMGRSALYYDDYVTALNYFNRVLEARPTSADAYYLRAVAKFSLEDYGGAERDLDKAIDCNPFKNEFYQLRGLCRIHNKKLREAVEDYTHSLLEEPDNQGVRYNRTFCYMELKDHPAALAEAKTLVHKWPAFSGGYLLAAQAQLALKDTTAALRNIDSLLVLNARDAQAWAFKGRYALSKNEATLADSFLTQAIKYQPRVADHYLLRAQARHALNKYGLALADYDETLRLIPEHFVAHYNRGLLRSFVGDDNRAIEDFDFVIAKEPDNTLAVYNRAQLHERVGDFRKAEADYSRLLRTYPNFLYGYAARARCRRHLGNTKGALADETRLQRSELDVLFAQQKKTPLKKVRKRSEHALEQYQQLIEDNEEPSRTYMSEFAGKVQNRKTERVFLPMFSVVRDVTDQGYRGEIFTPLSLQLKARHYIVASNETLPLSARELSHLLNIKESEGKALWLAQQARESTTPQAAIDLLDTALKLQPEAAYLHYNKGCVWVQMGEQERALSAFNEALKLDPQMPEAYYNRAVVYLLKQENLKAIPDLSKAGELGIFRAYNLLKQAKASLDE